MSGFTIMSASDDPKAAKQMLLDLMKQAKEQWECVFQLTATSKEIADRDRPRQSQARQGDHVLTKPKRKTGGEENVSSTPTRTLGQ